MAGLQFGAAQNAEKIYLRTNDAVVRIFTYNSDKTLHAQGSGVILKKKGWIITNYHVMGDATTLVAEHNGKKIIPDSVIAFDEKKDILIMKLPYFDDQKAFKNIPDLAIEKSVQLRVGQKVFAIGSPMGFENTLTEGIISGLRTSFDSAQSYIQISAPISSGSSGGAVLNEKGRLIGISSMVILGKTAQNLNFAVLMDDVILVSQKSKKVLPSGAGSALEFYFNRGHSEYLSKNYLTAIINYEKALKENPDRIRKAGLYHNLALAYFHLGLLDSSFRYFDRSLRLHVQPDVCVALGELYHSKKNYEKAKYYYKMALAKDSVFAGAYLGLGIGYYTTGNYDSSLICLVKAVKYQLEPEPRSLFITGKIANKLEKREIAITCFKEVIRNFPGYAEAYLELANIYQQMGDTEAAQHNEQTAYRLKPELKGKAGD